MIVDALKSQRMAPDLVAEFIDEFHREVNRQRQRAGLERSTAQSELATVIRKLDGLVDAIADGLRVPDLQRWLDELGARKKGLETRRDAPAPSPVRLHPNLTDLYRRKVNELHAALGDPELRAEALDLIRGLIERVEFYPAEDGSRSNSLARLLTWSGSLRDRRALDRLSSGLR